MAADDRGATRATETTPRLRVAVVAPPWYEVPPAGYGGTETVVAGLVDQLVAHGHDVTLVGSGRNLTRATAFLQVFDEPPSAHLGEPLPEVIHAAEVARLLDDLDVDVVHDNSLAGPLLARSRRRPTVVTMHGPADDPWQARYYAALGDAIRLVAISGSQRSLAPTLPWVATVHNALDVASFPFEPRKDDYVLWLGRFAETKGPDIAVEAARRAGMRLVLAGKANEPAERRYLEDVVEPLLGPDVEHVGEADAEAKRELLAHARALLLPLRWHEPFGMVMVEAMACGTPVVALRRGSAPEVVAHGRTGFVVDDPAELPDALAACDTIDPQECRRWVERRFDLPVMAAGYERVYREAVAAAGQDGPGVLSPVA
jgi:glycosyltransferase involved in cell wall biosynthesis